MTIKYNSHLVAGFCLLPTYLMAGILLSGIHVLLWFSGVAVIMLTCSFMYHALVLKTHNSPLARPVRYWLTFGMQIVFWAVVLCAYNDSR